MEFQPTIKKQNTILRAIWRVLVETIQFLVLVAALYTIINLALPRYIVEGRSMQPIFNGRGDERVIVNRVEYFLRDPQRGDIIILQNPDDPATYYIKRIIGLPGETIEMEAGKVYINGEPIEEPYVLDLCHTASCTSRTWHLEDDQFFVLGDNRNASHDSVAFGAIQRSSIVGRAWIHYWPPEEWKLFEHFDYSASAAQ